MSPTIYQVNMIGGSGVTPLFMSNFAGSDWTDNGKWEVVSGTNHNTYLLVFTTSLDADVPGGRGLRHIGTVGNNFFNVAGITSGYRPANVDVGGSITWRWYHKMVDGIDQDSNYHPLGWSNSTGSPPPWALITYQGYGSGNFEPRMAISGHAETSPFDTSASILLASDVWYRWEITWTRTGTSTWTCAGFRIYNASNTLILDAEDMKENFGLGPATLQDLPFTNSDVQGASEFCGWGNGLSGTITGTLEADRYAGVAAGSGVLVNIPYGYFDGEV